MGKETKIGLAVIGLLLLVFGVLLFRKMTASDEASSLDPSAVASVSSADKPDLVAAQPDTAERSKGENRWNGGDRGRELSAEPAGGAPTPRYLPRVDAADDRPTEEPTHDRYARPGVLTAAEETNTPNAQTGGSNPFRKPGSSAGPDEALSETPPRVLGDAANDAAALETQREQPVRSVRNPLRRLSAQTPVELEEPVAGSRPARADALPAVAATGTESESAEPTVRRDDLTLAGDEDRAASTTDNIGPAAAPSPAPSQWQSAGPVERPLPRARETVPVGNGEYTVQPNDSLWTISEKVYGTGGYFKAIYEHNRAKLPRADRLVVGTAIAVPPAATLEQNYPALCPRQRKSAMVKPRTMQTSTRARKSSGDNVYVVEEGDTLFDIARYELGKASRWAEIYDLNREVLGEDFDYLQPGTELTLPAKTPAADSVTRQRDSRYQR